MLGAESAVPVKPVTLIELSSMVDHAATIKIEAEIYRRHSAFASRPTREEHEYVRDFPSLNTEDLAAFTRHVVMLERRARTIAKAARNAKQRALLETARRECPYRNRAVLMHTSKDGKATTQCVLADVQVGPDGVVKYEYLPILKKGRLGRARLEDPRRFTPTGLQWVGNAWAGQSGTTTEVL